MGGINGISSNQENIFINTLENTQASQAANTNPNVVLPKETQGSSDPNNDFLPDAPRSNNVDPKSLEPFVASLTPGALLAAVLVKDAAQQNYENTKELMNRSMSVQKSIKDQADKIESGALKQLIFSCVGAAFNMIGSIAGTFVGIRGEGDALKINQTKGQCVTHVFDNAGNILNSIGSYLNTCDQADSKRMESGIERDRTAMEVIKNSMQAQRDLISKSIDIINSMQASRNQTMTRIMG